MATLYNMNKKLFDFREPNNKIHVEALYRL